MANKPTSEGKSVMEQNIGYYDEIAARYDETLDKNDTNALIRDKVAAMFVNTVPSGTVLDFGGGTGKDLPWLIKKDYGVIFCEPSAGMREKAISLNKNILHSNKIVFLDTAAADFTQWDQQLPFPQKVDAILANFSVLNSIPGIEKVFESLSRVIQPGAHFFSLVLKASWKKRWRANRRGTLQAVFTGATVTADILHNKHKQRVYLYTISQLKKAAAPYFHFHSREVFKENDFVLIHFTRK